MIIQNAGEEGGVGVAAGDDGCGGADADGEVRRRYGVRRQLGVLPGRVTYVIDRHGVVRHVFASASNIGGHVNGALEVVEKLRAETA